jgi:hypothetical protein
VTTNADMGGYPTTERLARALEEAGAPTAMIERARQGYYDDFKSPLAMPEMQLLTDARAAGLESIAEGVLRGEWDATKEESDAWARSPEGQAAFQELLGPNRADRRHPKR